MSNKDDDVHVEDCERVLFKREIFKDIFMCGVPAETRDGSRRMLYDLRIKKGKKLVHLLEVNDVMLVGYGIGAIHGLFSLKDAICRCIDRHIWEIMDEED